MRKIRQNLFWALGYNSAAIPIAALGPLNPNIAAAVMSLISFSVVANAETLRTVRLEPRRSATGREKSVAAPAPSEQEKAGLNCCGEKAPNFRALEYVYAFDELNRSATFQHSLCLINAKASIHYPGPMTNDLGTFAGVAPDHLKSCPP